MGVSESGEVAGQKPPRRVDIENAEFAANGRNPERVYRHGRKANTGGSKMSVSDASGNHLAMTREFSE
jgi:hypothetical protein